MQQQARRQPVQEGPLHCDGLFYKPMRDSHGDSETAAVCEGMLTWSIQGINNASEATDYAADSFIPAALVGVHDELNWQLTFCMCLNGC